MQTRRTPGPRPRVGSARAAAAVVLALLLSGCVGGDEATPIGPDDLDTSSTDPDGVLNATLPTLGPAVDPWLPDETERIVAAGTTRADHCVMTGAGHEPDSRELLGTPLGCSAEIVLDGPIVLDGTARVRLETDARQALKSGGFHAYMYTHVRILWDTGEPGTSANGETSTDPVHTWVWDVVPEEWDAAHWTSSQAVMGFWPSGAGLSLLDGTIQYRIVAERDPTWTPEAPLDHWALTGRHEMPQAGVITVLNTTITWAQPPLGAGTWPEPPTFTDRVPIGTSTVAVGLAWTSVDGCTTLECRAWADAVHKGRYLNGLGDAIASRGPTHVVSTWSAPDPFFTEPDHTEANRTYLDVFVTTMCPQGATCGYPATPTRTELRVLAEAWRDDFDLEAFEARLNAR